LETVKFFVANYSGLGGADIIHVGDLGFGFSSKDSDYNRISQISKAAKHRDINLYLLRGNHDDPHFWNQPKESSNLFFVSDYSEAIFPNGKTVLMVGGSISIDRFCRKLNVSYWEDEGTIYKKVDKVHDMLIAHDAPSYFNNSTESLSTFMIRGDKALFDIDPTLKRDLINQREIIDKIVVESRAKYIWSGHYHNSKSERLGDIIYRCLGINEFLTIDADAL